MSDRQKVNETGEAKQKCALFADYARYYDLLYKDKDYESEADYVAGMIRCFHPTARSVLELGSGTGIHAIHLAKKGYEVTGVEISTDMIGIARSKASPHSHSPNPAFFQGDIRTVRLNRTYDTIIAIFHVMSYQTTNADIVAAFATVREHLGTGGIFLFDVWYGPAVLTERPTVRIKRMADEGTAITRIAEPVMKPNENLVEVHYQVFVEDRGNAAVKMLQETHVMRYFFLPELELLAARNGLHIMNAEEWLTGKPISANTWGAFFVMQMKSGQELPCQEQI